FEVRSAFVQGSRHQREFSSASETCGNTGTYGCTRSLVSSRGAGRRFRRPDTEDKSLPGRVLGRLRRESSRARAPECPESYLLSACPSACRKAPCGLVPRRSGHPNAMRQFGGGPVNYTFWSWGARAVRNRWNGTWQSCLRRKFRRRLSSPSVMFKSSTSTCELPPG